MLYGRSSLFVIFLYSHWTGEFAGTAKFDNESGDSIFADFSIRHLVSDISMKLFYAAWPVILTRGKNVFRTGGMT